MGKTLYPGLFILALRFEVPVDLNKIPRVSFEFRKNSQLRQLK